MNPAALPAVRDPGIDALRGFALGGILLVNIQSFLWGGTNPAGTLPLDAPAIDRVAFFLTAAFVNVKFMPLFALLFGVGFAMLYDRLRATTVDPARVYRRRMGFLFVFGILHGTLLYFGDITQMYALAGWILLLYVDHDAASLRHSTLRWWLAAAALVVVLTWAVAGLAADADLLAEDAERNFAVFTSAGYWAQLPTRVSLFIDIIVGNVMALPMTVALMLTGMLARRSGWLDEPRAAVWRHALMLGLAIGLPSALLYGALLLAEVQANGRGAYSVLSALPALTGVTLAFAYAAPFLRNAPAAAVRWLAPAGRMPLTNYLLQSLLMGALLSGWGLGLGERFGYTGLAGLALALYALQLAVSRAWLLHWKQGPVEALWRRWTYAGLARPTRDGVRS